MPNLQVPYGVLLVNLGTPSQPTVGAIRRYLREFLSDPRVIDAPRWFWLPILNGVILPFRPKRLVSAYREIWQAEGSPLRVITQEQRQKLQQLIRADGINIPVEIAMTYGEPSIADGLHRLEKQGAQRLIILPLFPQYSATTHGAVFDKLARVLKNKPLLPDIRIVPSYHLQPEYIQALAIQIQQHWEQHGQGQCLLFSFHGLPKKYYTHGDPYPDYCHATAKAVATQLRLSDSQWQVSFQSRFGPAEWVKPYTQPTLEAFPEKGIKHVDVISPGFAADCLETLEELKLQNRDAFLEAGGAVFHYIPALNASSQHIDCLKALVVQQAQGW